jgi:hypothetical protein
VPEFNPHGVLEDWSTGKIQNRQNKSLFPILQHSITPTNFEFEAKD